MLTLVPSSARTTSGNSGILQVSLRLDRLSAGAFVLDVSAAAAAAGDTLDVYVQSVINGDQGSPWWDDFIHFTQVLGNGGAKRIHALWLRDYAPATQLGAVQDAAMAAGVLNGPIGDSIRVKWVIGGATPSFTFSLGVNPVKFK